MDYVQFANQNISKVELNIVSHPQTWAELAEKKFNLKTLVISRLKYESLDYTPYDCKEIKNLLIKIAESLKFIK